MKYCGLEVFWKEYFMLGTSGHEANSKKALVSLEKKSCKILKSWVLVLDMLLLLT